MTNFEPTNPMEFRISFCETENCQCYNHSLGINKGKHLVGRNDEIIYTASGTWPGAVCGGGIGCAVSNLRKLSSGDLTATPTAVLPGPFR